MLTNIILDQYNHLACAYDENQTCNKGEEVCGNFESACLSIIPLILWQVGLETTQSLITQYCQITLTRKLEDCLNERKFSNQVAYSMSFNEGLGSIWQNIVSDGEGFSDANALMASASVAAQNGFMVVNDLVKLSKFIPVWGGR